MDNVIISLEATCDLTPALIKEYDLNVVNMHFMIDGEDYDTSTSSVSSSRLYEKMRKGSKTSTSQVNESIYTEFFENLLQQNKPIIHLAFSSGLSNTYFTALSASDKINAKYGKKIYVVDSLCACGGHGMYAILVREFAKNASSVDEIVDYAEKLKHNINHVFSVDHLKYLANGGRIKRTSATIGTLLNIKPVMRVDEVGKLVVTGKVMSRKKALLAMCDKFFKAYDKNYTHVFISHADCLSDAEFIKSTILKSTSINVTITDLGPVIGCHSGPGTISLYFVSTNGR